MRRSRRCSSRKPRSSASSASARYLSRRSPTTAQPPRWSQCLRPGQAAVTSPSRRRAGRIKRADRIKPPAGGRAGAPPCSCRLRWEAWHRAAAAAVAVAAAAAVAEVTARTAGSQQWRSTVAHGQCEPAAHEVAYVGAAGWWPAGEGRRGGLSRVARVRASCKH